MPPRKLTLKGIKVTLDDLRASMYKQIGHERDSRTELEHRVQARLEETVTRDYVAEVTNAAAEAKEVPHDCVSKLLVVWEGPRIGAPLRASYHSPEGECACENR